MDKVKNQLKQKAFALNVLNVCPLFRRSGGGMESTELFIRYMGWKKTTKAKSPQKMVYIWLCLAKHSYNVQETAGSGEGWFNVLENKAGTGLGEIF